ncbi:MAG TPA: hypothetical protein VFA45_19615 [Actinomycetes bacterium]|jgi:hypothetical protein|nr:hypothetical protein [Actinomycetes bacterium]
MGFRHSLTVREVVDLVRVHDPDPASTKELLGRLSVGLELPSVRRTDPDRPPTRRHKM